MKINDPYVYLLPNNQGTKSTAKEQSIKTYTPYNPSIKKEPVYIDTVVPLSANAIAKSLLKK